MAQYELLASGTTFMKLDEAFIIEAKGRRLGLSLGESPRGFPIEGDCEAWIMLIAKRDQPFSSSYDPNAEAGSEIILRAECVSPPVPPIRDRDYLYTVSYMFLLRSPATSA